MLIPAIAPALREEIRSNLGFHVLRLFLGFVLIFHGIFKLRNGIDGIEQHVIALGMPGFIAYGVYLGEVLAPTLLILGILVRPAAILVCVNMLFALYMVHWHQVFTLNPAGGWTLELQGFYFFAALAVALSAGRAKQLRGLPLSV